MKLLRKFYVLVNRNGEFLCDINKFTRDLHAAYRWLSETAAIEAFARAKNQLSYELDLNEIEIEVPFPSPTPTRYIHG